MLKINNEVWDIAVVPPSYYKLQKPDGSWTVAACDDWAKTIYLSRNLKGAFLRKVLYHEVAHAVLYSYDVDIPISQQELLCDIIATYGDEIAYITDRIYERL